MNYKDERAVLIDYMHTKIKSGDWHAVSDVANDLRVLEATNAPGVRALKEFVTVGPYKIDNRESPLTACDPKPEFVPGQFYDYPRYVQDSYPKSRDPFKDAGWPSNPIKFGPCGCVSEGTGFPCILPAKHTGDHVFEKGAELRCKYTAGDRCIRPYDHDGDHYFS